MTDILELMKLGSPYVLALAAVWAVRYLATRLESVERQLVNVLCDALRQNTVALTRIEEVLARCHGKPHTEHLTRLAIADPKANQSGLAGSPA